ncbi:MAG: hypothetical protein ABI583_05620 [Betaproteobacteria bacterium]
MNALFTSAAVTLLAGMVPLVPMSSPTGTLVNSIAILIAIVGAGFTLMLYFSDDDNRLVVGTALHGVGPHNQ